MRLRITKRSSGWLVLIAVVAILIGMQLYLQVAPPVTVVSSGSMQHSGNWQYNVLNTGDMALIKKVSKVSDVVTYVQGRNSNYSTFGEYGNVIVYNSDSGILIIHRAILYLSWKDGLPVVGGYHNQSWMEVNSKYILIKDMGYAHRNLVIYISNYTGKSGFITTGDYNLGSLDIKYNATLNAYGAADQDNIFSFSDPPVNVSQVVGKAVLDVPWVGLLKLTVSWELGYMKPSPVPNGSYEYLVLSLAAVFTAALFPYKRTMRLLRSHK